MRVRSRTRPSEQRVHRYGDHLDRQQEVGAAADVLGREALGALGGDLDAVLVRGDRLVLGAVVLEQPAHIGQSPHEDQIGQEDRQPQDALGDVEHHTMGEHVPRGPRDDGGQHDEQAREQHEGQRHAEGDGAFAQLDVVVVGDGLLGRPRQRPHPEHQGLRQRHDAPNQRHLAPALRPRGRIVDLDLDGPLGRAHRDRVDVFAAHHHAVEDGLPSDVSRRRLRRHDCYFAAFLVRFP
jgi:hypothetical protein